MAAPFDSDLFSLGHALLDLLRDRKRHDLIGISLKHTINENEELEPQETIREQREPACRTGRVCRRQPEDCSGGLLWRRTVESQGIRVDALTSTLTTTVVESDR